MDWDDVGRTIAEVLAARFPAAADFAISAEERRNAPVHCGPNDSFPIRNARDAHNAWMLAGHADDPNAVRACIKRVAKQKGYPLPSSAMMAWDVVYDAAAAATDADGVRLTGKIFEIGDYPDKGFALSEAEADAAIAAFRRVAGDHGHARAGGPLDGQLGVLESVWRQGRDLFGTFHVPEWLLARVPEAARKISLQWSIGDDGSKHITKWGWVTEPRIQDAVLAAFNATHAAEEEPNMADTLDMIIDRLRLRGARERADGDGAAAQTQASGGTFSAADLRSVPISSVAPNPPPPPNPEVDALRVQLKAQQDATQRLIAERNAERAHAFVDAQIRAGKLLPVERAQLALETLYSAALANDAANSVTFAVGTDKISGLAGVIDALFAALPAHELRHDGDAAHVLMSRDVPGAESKGPSPERLNALLGMTDVGRTALRHMNGKE